MNAELKVIRLSSREFMYLKNTAFLPASLARLVDSAKAINPKSYALSIPHDTADKFRSALTERLARAGLGADYELTGEGKTIEDLIDRFQ